jgi:hypothetical protein
VTWGRVSAVVGIGVVVVGLLTQPPTQPSVATVVFGLVAVVVSTMTDQIAKISGPGFHVETRPPPEPERLSQEIDRLRERRPDPAVVGLPGRPWDAARYMLGTRTIEMLLGSLAGHLEGCKARVFFYDQAEGKLMPAYRPADAPGEPLGWAVGQGVTGVAFATGRYVRAVGAGVHDPRWGLDVERERRGASLTAVAAVPLWDRGGRVLGTLTLSSRGPDARLTTAAGYEEHLALAQQVSVCVTELLIGGDAQLLWPDGSRRGGGRRRKRRWRR